LTQLYQHIFFMEMMKEKMTHILFCIIYYNKNEITSYFIIDLLIFTRNACCFWYRIFDTNRFYTNDTSFPSLTLFSILVLANITTPNYWSSSTTAMRYLKINFCIRLYENASSKYHFYCIPKEMASHQHHVDTARFNWKHT